MKQQNLYTKDPWHGVEIHKKSPQIVNSVIEIPKGSQAKYEIDKKTGLLKLDRILYSAVHYPSNYGYIPRSLCDDNDALDILVLCEVDVFPLTIMEARVIGVMNMVDQGEQDDKIIAVAQNDVSFSNINDFTQLPPYKQEQIVKFFEDYKKLEKKDVKVNPQFLGKEEAYKIIEESYALYNKTFPEDNNQQQQQQNQ